MQGAGRDTQLLSTAVQSGHVPAGESCSQVHLPATIRGRAMRALSLLGLLSQLWTVHSGTTVAWPAGTTAIEVHLSAQLVGRTLRDFSVGLPEPLPQWRLVSGLRNGGHEV